MKIGVVSDSHLKVNFTKEALDFLKNQGASYFIHAGDVGCKKNLELLKNTNLPYVCVFGNNDNHLLKYQNDYAIYKEPYYFNFDAIGFKLMHLPFYLASKECNVVIFGHTHSFECDYKNQTLFLNPGEICAREKPYMEAVLLEITNNEYIIHYYTKELSASHFERKEIRYERN